MILAGLASALFLGGWLLPGVPAPRQDAHPWLEAAGAVILLGKTGAVALLLASVRAFGPRASLAAGARATLVKTLPAALVVLAATVAWTRWSPGPATQTLVSSALFSAATLAAAALVQRVLRGLHSPAPRLSPFL